ncbi:hypothetical protein CJU78_23840 [Pseudomonas fragi]|nr:hypothetical protein CJU78_23840 [Pseudomonas fragi]
MRIWHICRCFDRSGLDRLAIPIQVTFQRLHADLDPLLLEHIQDRLLSCFRNYVILAASNAQTSDKASEILGQQEVRRMRVSFSNGRSNRSPEIKKEPVVMDSEISNLKDLEAYLKFGEDFPITKIKLPYVNHKERAQGIVVAGQAA